MAALFRGDFTSSKRAEPRNVATVGKKSAPQNVLVTDTGSDGGGRLAALAEPSATGSVEKAGRMYLVSESLGSLDLIKLRTGSCHLIILANTSPTGTRGRDTKRKIGSAVSMRDNPLS